MFVLYTYRIKFNHRNFTVRYVYMCARFCVVFLPYFNTLKLYPEQTEVWNFRFLYFSYSICLNNESIFWFKEYLLLNWIKWVNYNATMTMYLIHESVCVCVLVDYSRARNKFMLMRFCSLCVSFKMPFVNRGEEKSADKVT